jgi:hypothetical protein
MLPFSKNFFWTLKKRPVSLGNGAFLPIAASYFKVCLRHDGKRNVRMKRILITAAAGNWVKNDIRRGRQR